MAGSRSGPPDVVQRFLKPPSSWPTRQRTSNLQDVALPLFTERVAGHFGRHALLNEGPESRLIVDGESLLGAVRRVADVELQILKWRERAK